MYKVLIAENEGSFICKLNNCFSRNADFEIVGTVGSYEGVLEFLRNTSVDCILLCNCLLNGDCGDIIQRIKELSNSKVAVFSLETNLNAIKVLFHSGVDGFFFRGVTANDLVNGLRIIMNGGVHIDTTGLQSLLHHILTGTAECPANMYDAYGLTKREREVFDLAGSGLTVKEIAFKLHICKKTAETHRANIMAKADIESATQFAIAAFALKNGYSGKSNEN
jgi:DNA-binding NarL/FixJ family response regulator